MVLSAPLRQGLFSLLILQGLPFRLGIHQACRQLHTTALALGMAAVEDSESAAWTQKWAGFFNAVHLSVPFHMFAKNWRRSAHASQIAQASACKLKTHKRQRQGKQEAVSEPIDSQHRLAATSAPGTHRHHDPTDRHRCGHQVGNAPRLRDQVV